MQNGENRTMAELLAPAGSLESLLAGVNAGADAVYIGGSMFGARAYADNPGEADLERGIEYCHLHGRKIYLTVNTLLKSKELEEKLYSFLLPLYYSGVDGLIVQDLGVARFVQKHFPGLDLHASTQMTVTSSYGARMLKEMGITRAVPARELSLDEIRNIIKETGLEIETFIHGAMCYCYSGQCLFSSMLGGRSGNRGRCAQPCRLPYQRVSGTDSGSSGKSHKGKQPSFASGHLLSMKDMCTIDLLPDLLEAGIGSLKIEGRMKRPEYTAGVVSVYRKYIDLYQRAGRKGYRIDDEDRRLLMDLYNRGGFSQGYYHKKNGRDMMAVARPNHQGTEAAIVKTADKQGIYAVALEPLHKNDVLEIAKNTEITLGTDQREGAWFRISGGRVSVKPGTVLYRTKNQQLLQTLEAQFLNTDLKEKIKGELRIFQDSPAILEVTCRGIHVSVSELIAEPAQSQATSAEAVEKQIKKTGGTPFEFEHLSVFMEPQLFLPVKKLNELRRHALEALEKALREGGRRQEPVSRPRLTGALEEPCQQQSDQQQLNQRQTDSAWKQTVLVTTEEQLLAVLGHVQRAGASNTDTLYLDSFLLGKLENLKNRFPYLQEQVQTVKSLGIRCFLNFPPVFRRQDQDLLLNPYTRRLMEQMDGFLIHTLDQLAFARDFMESAHFTGVLAGDESLYAYNHDAVAFWQEQGVGRMTLPAELNFKELTALKESQAGAASVNLRTELNIYGYQPLMQSAQCVTKNTTGCTGIPSITYLKDRKNVCFPVLNRCGVCCNTIYNSVPLHLGGCSKELQRLRPDYMRLTFTIESGAETARILELYHGIFQGHSFACEEIAEGTRGHFRRGVE